MTQRKFVPGRGYTKADWDAVDSPELTDEELATARPFADVFPGPVEIIGSRRGRPKLDAPKEAVTLRLDPETLARFKAQGDDWRKRMSDILDKTAP
jgi:uncharacterized protein (DUF4415 family)